MKPTLPLAIIGVALTGLVGYHGIYVRQQAQVRLIQAQLDQEQVSQSARADVAAELDELERYRSRLPPEPNPTWIVREAAAVAERLGVQLTTISQDAPNPFQQFTRLSVTLQLRASYHQLGAFLDQLERSDHYVHVDSVDVSSRSQQPGGLATIRLVLSTVHLPPVHIGAGG